jgi:hypothetical protein
MAKHKEFLRIKNGHFASPFFLGEQPQEGHPNLQKPARQNKITFLPCGLIDPHLLNDEPCLSNLKLDQS